MVTAKLYIESGDDSRERGIRIREGWNEFFKTVGIEDRVRVVRGGDRRQTLKRWFKSVARPESEIVSLAIVDSQQPIGEGQTVWQHLKECYGWERPQSAMDDPEVLAVSAPESAYVHLTSDLASEIVSRLNVVFGRPRPEYGEESRAAETLHDTSQPEEIIATLRRAGLPGVADRLGYIRQLEHEEEVVGDSPMALDSLRQLARFLMAEQWLPEPEIGVSPNGLAHAEWRFPAVPANTSPNGLLVMEFLCCGRVRFAAIANGTEADHEPSRINGTLYKVEALRAVQPFTERLFST